MGLGEALAIILAAAAVVGGAVALVGTAVRSARRRIAERPGFGYMLAAGIVGFVTGVLMLTLGRSTFVSGWACLTVGCGAALLVGAVLIEFEIDVAPSRDTVIAAGLSLALIAVAALYLTHPAEDLPRLLPGHDADSQHLLVTYGLLTALLSLLPLKVMYATARPRHTANGSD